MPLSSLLAEVAAVLKGLYLSMYRTHAGTLLRDRLQQGLCSAYLALTGAGEKISR